MPLSNPRSVELSTSVVGTSHIRKNVACQDYCRQYRRGGALNAVLGDGAGSAKLSGVGARIAVDAAVAWLKKNALSAADPDPERHLRRCLTAVHWSLERYAVINGCRTDDLATTIVIAVVWSHEAIAARVGDGAIVLRERGGSYATLSREKKTGAGNATSFITDQDYDERAEFSRLEGCFEGLVAMTDGLEALAFSPDRTPYAPFLNPLLSHLVARGAEKAHDELKRFLQGERVRSASDDDLSLVLAHWGKSR